MLDITREEVREYLFTEISAVLKEGEIDYVKWDMNRNLSDVWSKALPKERQGEVYHRYVLGVYALMEHFVAAFPDILWESCSGGGGRFDAGILYYMPQIWCSDTTDAIERLGIQYGASFGYPVSAMGSHVSTVPNHQTGRITPLSTRGCVAMAGTFGYELDIEQMTPEEKEEVRKQIAIFQTYAPLIQKGVYYRLSSPLEGTCTVWEIADPDGREALVSAVYHHAEANPVPVRARVQGLRDELYYRLRLHEDFAEKYPERTLPYGFGPDETISGAALRQYGFVVPDAADGFQAWQISVEVCGEG